VTTEIKSSAAKSPLDTGAALNLVSRDTKPPLSGEGAAPVKSPKPKPVYTAADILGAG
jgi:hypothetical protein